MKTRIYLITVFIILSSAAFSYAALDLKFMSAININPASPKVGDTVTFSVSIKAEGAIATNVKIIGSVDGTQVHERVFASIPADATRTDSFTWTATVGSHSVSFTLDPAHTSGDSNYDNNTVSKTMNVSNIKIFLKFNEKALILKPDLIVKSVIISPIAIEDENDSDDVLHIAYECYRKWGLRVRVRNDGNKRTEEGFLITIMIDGTDEYVYEVFGPIMLDAGHEHEFYKAGYTTYKNTVRVVASVDSSHKIAESDETNNLLTITKDCDE